MTNVEIFKTLLFTFTALEILLILLWLIGLSWAKKLIVHNPRFILIGTLFIFSGIVKGIDPLGTAYKMEEYFTVFGMEFLKPFALEISMTIIIAEIILGWSLILGTFPHVTTLLSLLLMVFFTFLTFYTWWFNKVTDCGCFGDFMKLKPFETFYKDIILTIISIILFIARKHIQPFLPKALTYILLCVGISFAIAFSFRNILDLPIVNFRPYKNGVNILNAKTMPANAPTDKFSYQYTYINKNTAEKLIAPLPPKDLTNWKFIDRNDILVSKGYEPPIHDFVLHTYENFDVTDSVLQLDEPMIWILSKDVSEMSSEGIQKIARLMKDLSIIHPNIVIKLITTADVQIATKIILDNDIIAEPLMLDGTQIKTMMRSNPGIMLINKGIIHNQWHWRNLPTAENMLD